MSRRTERSEIDWAQPRPEGAAGGRQQYSSGSKRVPGAVTKHGNPRLRAALVELAWRLVHFQLAYPPIHKPMEVLRRGSKAPGSARKKAIVAVARQLGSPTHRTLTIPFRHLGRGPLALVHRSMHGPKTRPPVLTSGLSSSS